MNTRSAKTRLDAQLTTHISLALPNDVVKQLQQRMNDTGVTSIQEVIRPIISDSLKEGRECEVTIRIPYKDQEAFDHLLKAQKELASAGVMFDSGSWIANEQITINIREWQFDFSLKGAKVILKKVK